MATKYYCPKDKDQELVFDDSGGHAKKGTSGQVDTIVSPERPVQCPVCKLSYYKWEALQK